MCSGKREGVKTRRFWMQETRDPAQERGKEFQEDEEEISRRQLLSSPKAQVVQMGEETHPRR